MSLNVVILFVEYGVNVNYVDKDGDIFFIYVVFYLWYENVRILFECGSDYCYKN